MGSEVGGSRIFFRAQTEYEGGPVQAEAMEAEYNADTLYRHIGSNGVSTGDPYISMSERIETALLKYSYGKLMNGDGEYRYNAKRTKILLINLPERNAEETVDTVSPKPNGYFATDVLLNGSSQATSAHNYIAADREVIAYRQIDEEYVHEVHPILADLLFALTVTGNRGAYDEIVNKIITGELSVEAVNDKFFGEGKSKLGMEFNDVERIFMEKYYGERENIVTVYDQCFPSRIF